MDKKYTHEDYLRHYREALKLFNKAFPDSGLNEDTIKIGFYGKKNPRKTYDDFCREDFPNRLHAPDNEKDFFKYAGAIALLGNGKYGILIDEDLHEKDKTDMTFIFLHELSHLFCLDRESDGEDFSKKYSLSGNPYLSAGHQVWRETIADVMAGRIMQSAGHSLAEISELLMNYYSELIQQTYEPKKTASLILQQIILAPEIDATKDWSEAEEIIREYCPYMTDAMIRFIEMAYEQFRKPEYWKITPYFIEEFGELFMYARVEKLFDN